MTRLYEVKITPQAQKQLTELVTYILVQLKSPKAAWDLLHTLENAIATLDRFPYRIALTEEEPWHEQGIHKMPVKNFLVYFWINETLQQVHVVAIIPAKRNQIKLLPIINLK
jgi:toxin ParE1/3/4